LFDLHLVAALMHAGWLVQEEPGRGEAPAVGAPRQHLVFVVFVAVMVFVAQQMTPLK